MTELTIGVPEDFIPVVETYEDSVADAEAQWLMSRIVSLFPADRCEGDRFLRFSSRCVPSLRSLLGDI